MRKSFTHSVFYKALTVSALFICYSVNMEAQVSGNVFRDFNANGIKTTAAPDPIEVGLKDVTVNAYPTTGALITTTTDTNGDYSITGGTGSYRVEFILPIGFFASNGVVSNSTVQFVVAGGTANLGVKPPTSACSSTNPNLITPKFSNGSRLDNPNEDAIIIYDHNKRGQNNTFGQVASATTIK